MSIVAISNTSTYIQGGLDVETTVSGSNIIVTEKLYFRRTNAYSGSTYSSSVSGTLYISTQATSSTTNITVAGGKQNVWQGPFYTATRTFDSSRSGNTITVSWSTTDNVSANFSGSGSASITLPTSATAPSGLAVSLSSFGIDWAKFAVSISSWGSPSGADGRWLEAGIAGQNAWQSPSLRSAIVKNPSGTSTTITVNNSSSQTTTLNITGNTTYYYGGYCNNTVMTASVITGTFTTLPNPPVISISNITATTATINWATVAEGNAYSKSIIVSGAGLSSKTIATVSSGSATSGTYALTGLTEKTTYTLIYYTKTTAGNPKPETISFTTAGLPATFYGSASEKAVKIQSFYGSVDGVAKGIRKLYASVDGKTKLIFFRKKPY